MEQFLIIFQCIPESIILYSLVTADLQVIANIKSIHRKYCNTSGLSYVEEQTISHIEDIEGIVKIIDDSDSEASMLPLELPVEVTGDLTIILTGFLM